MDPNNFLIITAIAVVTLDVVVRVYAMPNRRDWFYAALLEMQQGRAALQSTVKSVRPIDDEPLARALLEYFRQSFTSRQVMAALATSRDGIEGNHLERKVADHVAQKWNRNLSINAIRRVIMILMGSNLVELREGKFALTGTGWNLFHQTKSAAGPRWSEVPDNSPVLAA